MGRPPLSLLGLLRPTVPLCAPPKQPALSLLGLLRQFVPKRDAVSPPGTQLMLSAAQAQREQPRLSVTLPQGKPKPP